MLIISCFNHQNLKINGNVSKEEGRRRSFSVQSTFALYLLSSFKRQRNFLLTTWRLFLLHCASYPTKGQLNTVYEMGTKMKGFYKGFKYTLSQIFVVRELKEREIEIGYPTDVKHVAHIGWDGPSGSAPTWMNQFKTGPDFASTSIGNSGSALSPWSSQDYGESMRQQLGSDMFKDKPSMEHSPMKKKQRRKEKSSSSSPKSNCGSSSKSSKAKAKFVQGNSNLTNIEVA